MHPRRLFLGRVSIATGARDSATNKNKRFKGVRPQLICAATDLASKPLADFVPGAQAEPSGGDNGKMETTVWGLGLFLGFRVDRENGKAHGNCNNGLYRGYLGVHRVLDGFNRDNGKENGNYDITIGYWGPP